MSVGGEERRGAEGILERGGRGCNSVQVSALQTNMALADE